MMRSLFSGVSGLKNHQTRMDVIGNNISNVNTTGFKSGRVTFTDTLSQTLTGASKAAKGKGGTNPKQVGLGSVLGSIDTIFTNGSVQSTGKNTDLCLSGSGLFIVNDPSGTYYTRNGAFEFDEAGNYVLPGSGMFVKGWMAKDGVLPESKSAGNMANIVIPAGKAMAAKATTVTNYSNNLNASSPMIRGMEITYEDGSSAKLVTDKTTVVNIPTDTTSASVTVKLADGSLSLVPLTTANPGNYNLGGTLSGGTIVEIKYTTTAGVDTTVRDYVDFDEELPAGSKKITAATLKLSDDTTQVVTSGKYTADHSIPLATTVNVYDSLGVEHVVPINIEKSDQNTWLAYLAKTTLKEKGGDVKLEMEPVEIKFSEIGKFESGTGSLNLIYDASTAKAKKQDVTLNFSSLSQFSGSSTINVAADGNAAGNLSSVTIDSTGTITGTYTNGVVQAEAQVAVAQFYNPAGLTKTGNSLYQKSNNSGTATVSTAADLGVTITPSALEMSNVDVANEFSDMIITQRGFQSNSKIITVSDEMLETLINMKR